MSDHYDFPSSKRFLDIVTRSLESNDVLRHRAQNELAHLIEASPQATNEMLEDAAAKLELVERKNGRKWGLPLVGAVALVALAFVVGTTAYRFIQFRGFFGMVSPGYNGVEEALSISSPKNFRRTFVC